MFRSPFKYDRRAASIKSGHANHMPSLTVQSQREEADINTIVKRFGVTGLLPQGIKVPSFETFEDVWDYRTALHALREAEASFMALPAEVRSRFENDPAQFVEFCSDGRNIEEMRKMGLAVPKPENSPPPSPPSKDPKS